MTQDTTHTTAKGEAMDWLAGRLRWERILRELHDRADGTAPDPQIELPAAAHDRDDRAA